MTIEDKLTAIANSVPLVYDAGKKAEYDNFWDTFQANGTRTDYTQAFAGTCWNEKNLNPKYDICPASANYMFRFCWFTGDMVEHFDKLGIVFSFDNIVGMPTQVFREMNRVTRLFAVTKAFSSMNNWYTGCKKLETIDLITVAVNTTFTDTFLNCLSLKNITFRGVVGNSISFADSPLLTSESVQNVINALATVTEAKTITFNEEITLTDAQIAKIDGKGWDLVQ